jgi:hypothetical protein
MRGKFVGVAVKMEKDGKVKRTSKILLDKNFGNERLTEEKAANDNSLAAPPAFSPTGEIEHGFPASYSDWPVETSEPDKPRRGRPTIPDNHLLGRRNSWLYFFEEAWPEIGCYLLKIRKAGHATIDDVQRVFEAVPSKDNNDSGKAFLRGSPQGVDPKEMRRNKRSESVLGDKIQGMHSQCTELERICAEAEEAVKEADIEGKKLIEEELMSEKPRLDQLRKQLEKARSDAEDLHKAVLGQETHWYCSELLKFLCGKKQYSINPFKLANALAGLPVMGWRESYSRCSKMQKSSPFSRLPYLIFEVTFSIWRRKPEGLKSAPIGHFRANVLKLPKKDDGICATLCRGWRDYRRAIEECWNDQHSEDLMPCAITSAFLRNHLRTKTLVERKWDEREMLVK